MKNKLLVAVVVGSLGLCVFSPSYAEPIADVKTSLAAGAIASDLIDTANTVTPTVDTAYPMNPKTNVTLKANTPVQFYKTGFVASGTLASDVTLLINPQDSVTFAGGAEVWFDNNSSFVYRGVLAADTSLVYFPGTKATFKGGTDVVFYDSSFVYQGTVAQDTSFLVNPQESAVRTAGTVVTFDNDGFLEP
ncbi:MAG: hypothetical protein PHE17_20705 [Thiothrix sp.]|uniref:hypothetical protein n=1 Tax=Thiothrix sp. TaxID=1032 RepID=UPI0026210D19|nr:hypothetical protein [Thiothrix sp.]MDD5395452.1 hypothetical protein [Thiothrix sp.]